MTRKQPDKMRPGTAMPALDPSGYGKSPLPVRRTSPPVRLSRDLDGNSTDDADTVAGGRHRRIRRGLVPQTQTGRIAAAILAMAALVFLCAGSVLGARFIAADPRFRIPSSRAIEIDGNNHLTRSQMLSVFGEDVERNIFSVPMEQRRAQLEQMPWVEHATVMRLLPNRLRVHVVERVPVAFVREGGKIGLTDASGVLLDIPPDTPATSYMFPVVTGMRASETAEERAEQMRLYAAFMQDFDSDGKGTSALLSEIDLSDPEDAKALVPDHDREIMVHFGRENFLARYKRFEEHIAEWRSQYPRLSNVDMRYERQVVLQMPPKDAVPANSGSENHASPPQPQSASVGHLSVSPAARRAQAAPESGSSALQPAISPAGQMRGAKATSAATRPEEKDVLMRKRVEAIKAWMAQREKARAAAQARSAGTASGALNPER